MNIILHSERHRIQSKPSAIKVVMAIRRQHRSSTEQQDQSRSPQKNENSNEKTLVSLLEKSKDFTSIFAKHKRSQYSGYKKINMNQSAIIKLETEHKLANRYETSRQYEVNLKNIAKLRKRHSLQPLNFKQSQRNHKKLLMQTSEQMRNEYEMQREDVNSGRRAHRDLKQVIHEINHQNRISSERAFSNADKVTKYTERTPQNLSQAKKQIKLNQDDVFPEIGVRINHKQEISPKLIAIHRASITKVKAKPRIKIHQFIQIKKQADLENDLSRQQQSDLHGWSTQSFYPKKKFSFFKEPPNK